MRWLVHGKTTAAVGEALRQRGDSVHTIEELGLADAGDWLEVMKAAQKQQLEIMTADVGLANAPFEHQFPFNRIMVYLQLEGGDVEQDDAVARLFARYKRLSARRLYSVTGGRVKIRQLPGAAGH